MPQGRWRRGNKKFVPFRGSMDVATISRVLQVENVSTADKVPVFAVEFQCGCQHKAMAILALVIAAWDQFMHHPRPITSKQRTAKRCPNQPSLH